MRKLHLWFVTVALALASFAIGCQGDCNSCHTQNGANQAPGRILLP